MLPLPFLCGLWLLQGLAPSGYSLEGDGVRLERRFMPRLLPYRAILGCDRAPRPIGGLLALGLNGLFGAYGWRWNRRTGWHYLAITNTDDLVFLRTVGGLMVISPGQPDEFVALLGAELAGAGPRR
jgi:hypothetical protein